MKKLFILSVLGLCVANLIFAAPGQVTVDLQSSTDMSVWTSATEGAKTVSSPPVYFRASIVPVDGGEVAYSNVLEAPPAAPWFNVNLSLESSPDLSSWSDDVIGLKDVSSDKEFYRASLSSVYGDMVFVEGGAPGLPAVDDFLIGRYEVSKEEWDVIYAWATVDDGDKEYLFFEGLVAGPYGVGCAPNHPVAKLSWYDAIKWCNARSEYEGLNPVYYEDAGLNTVYRTGNIDQPYMLDPSDPNPGYRLLTFDEWEYAARGGVNSQPTTYSGSNTLNDVATYYGNSTGAECPNPDGRGTWPLATRSPNELGIFDMTGNVGELTNLDIGEPLGEPGNRNVRIRGGDYYFPLYLEVLNRGWSGPAMLAAEFNSFGFRVAKTVPQAVIATVEAVVESKALKRPKKSRPVKASFR